MLSKKWRPFCLSLNVLNIRPGEIDHTDGINRNKTKRNKTLQLRHMDVM